MFWLSVWASLPEAIKNNTQLEWVKWYLIFSNYFWVTLGGPQVFWAGMQKRWCKSSPGLNCSAGWFVRQQHFWSANSIYSVWSGNKWAGSCSRPVSLQPLPVTHTPSCHPLFQVLYYRLQARAGSWAALVTPALVDYGQDSWIWHPNMGAEAGPKSFPLITDRSRTCWS